MASERVDVLGKIALGLCLAGMALALTVGALALASPQSWTLRDASNTLLAAEVLSAFIGVLARRSPFGTAAIVIGGVLALGAWISTN